MNIGLLFSNATIQVQTTHREQRCFVQLRIYNCDRTMLLSISTYLIVGNTYTFRYYVSYTTLNNFNTKTNTEKHCSIFVWRFVMLYLIST